MYHAKALPLVAALILTCAGVHLKSEQARQTKQKDGKTLVETLSRAVTVFASYIVVSGDAHGDVTVMFAEPDSVPRGNPLPPT